jgi:PHP family Zn ribbon phosphoesterase
MRRHQEERRVTTRATCDDRFLLDCVRSASLSCVRCGASRRFIGEEGVYARFHHLSDDDLLTNPCQ